MAFNLGNKKGPIADINVTPLVDVMLVLLVIFMITAPMMFSGIHLKLPKTKKVNNLNLTQEQVILSMTAAGDLYIGNKKFLASEIIKEINARFKKHKTNILFVRAHYALSYGKVASLISKLKRSGIENISLVTERLKEK